MEEFSRVLHGDFTGKNSHYRVKDLSHTRWLITHTTTGVNIYINVNPLPPRELGLLKLPVLSVEFSGPDTLSSDGEQFFDKFFKYFHKGGG